MVYLQYNRLQKPNTMGLNIPLVALGAFSLALAVSTIGKSKFDFKMYFEFLLKMLSTYFKSLLIDIFIKTHLKN